jgi:hypothetical protein
MKLPKEIRRAFQRYGKKGGEARAKRVSAAARKAIARRAALQRWTEARFGNASFAALGLPGGEVIDSGLDDLVFGEVTIESLVVSLAAPRLRREGVPLPTTILSDADWRLYRLLEQESGDLAHARYMAYLRQVASFADACRTSRTDRGRRAG